MHSPIAFLLPLVLAGCLDMTPPTPPIEVPPEGSQDVQDISLIPPGGAPNAGALSAPPRISSVTILPDKPTTEAPLKAVVDAQDRDSENLDIDLVWVINDQDRPDLTTEELTQDHFKKGDTVAVKATVSDGDVEVEGVSAPVLVGNRPPAFLGDPRVSSKLDGMVLSAKDPDGDDLSYSISGAPVGMKIDSSRGRISYQGSEEEEGGAYEVSITVDDGDGGTAVWSFGLKVNPGSAAVKRAKDAAEAAAGSAATP